MAGTVAVTSRQKKRAGIDEGFYATRGTKRCAILTIHVNYCKAARGDENCVVD